MSHPKHDFSKIFVRATWPPLFSYVRYSPQIAVAPRKIIMLADRCTLEVRSTVHIAVTNTCPHECYRYSGTTFFSERFCLL